MIGAVGQPVPARKTGNTLVLRRNMGFQRGMLAAASFQARMLGHHERPVDHRHPGLGQPRAQRAADQLIRHRVILVIAMNVIIRPHLQLLVFNLLEPVRRQGPEQGLI